MAELLLDAWVRMGEMIAAQTSRGGSLKYKSGAPKTRPKGIEDKESHYAQQMAKHPDIVQFIKDWAREVGKLPGCGGTSSRQARGYTLR